MGKFCLFSFLISFVFLNKNINTHSLFIKNYNDGFDIVGLFWHSTSCRQHDWWQMLADWRPIAISGVMNAKRNRPHGATDIDVLRWGIFRKSADLSLISKGSASSDKNSCKYSVVLSYFSSLKAMSLSSLITWIIGINKSGVVSNSSNFAMTDWTALLSWTLTLNLL